MAKGIKTGGRKAGTPNKTTAAVKEAMSLAFEGIGGVPALQAWAAKNPDLFYPLWTKLLPIETKNEHAGPGGGALQVTWLPIQPPAK